ncbi:MAG TPA: HAD-IA family hydrolase, partial [Acidobacteriota bacterium]|nr:HAD-IA family hydrolase [Acidobacteriota bacterium]
MQEFEWITFDCYGTLIDWENGITAAFQKIARTAGTTIDVREVLKLYMRYEPEEERNYRKYSDVLTRVGRRICMELQLKTNSYDFLVESLPRWRPFPDTNPALERLAQNHRLGILSNIDKDLLAATRKHLPARFDLLITAEDVASYKPAPRHFDEARRKIGTSTWIHAAQSYFHDIVPCSRLNIPSA